MVWDLVVEMQDRPLSPVETQVEPSSLDEVQVGLSKLIGFSSQATWLRERRGDEEAGEAGRDASRPVAASSSGNVSRRESLPRPPPHTGDCSPLALPM